MAKDKKWIDCPVCGASGSMVLEKNRRGVYATKSPSRLHQGQSQ